MDNNFNRVRLCGRAAGEPELSHINHGESFYRFPLSVERLSGQEDRLPVILPRPLLEAHPVHTGDVLTLTGQLRSFNNRSWSPAARPPLTRFSSPAFCAKLPPCAGRLWAGKSAT